MLIYDTSKRISGEPLCTSLMSGPLNTCSISSQTGPSSQLFRGLPSVIAARLPDGTVPPYHPSIHPSIHSVSLFVLPFVRRSPSLHVFRCHTLQNFTLLSGVQQSCGDHIDPFVSITTTSCPSPNLQYVSRTYTYIQSAYLFAHVAWFVEPECVV